MCALAISTLGQELHSIVHVFFEFCSSLCCVCADVTVLALPTRHTETLSVEALTVQFTLLTTFQLTLAACTRESRLAKALAVETDTPSRSIVLTTDITGVTILTLLGCRQRWRW